MLKTRIILAVLLANLYASSSGAQSLDQIDFQMVQRLARNISEELWSVGEAITKRAEVQESFSQARIVNKDGARLANDIARDLKVMLDTRINALKRIVKTATDLPRVNENTTSFENYTFINSRDRDQFRKEYLAEKAIEDERLEKRSQDKNYTKKRKPVHESPYCFKSNDPRDDNHNDPDYGCMAKFNETLNVKSREASVFLPLDVFDKDGNMTRIIHRSKGLDKAFLTNFKEDPTIGWQYFCNSSGMFRHFPATHWSFHPINMYDCRMRHWFTGAASTSKDVMILIERSGSMLGKRIAIAIDVVRNILDTLTPNDFVNILQFNEASDFINNCSTGLVQATSSNIFELKQALNNIEPRGQTDLAEALWEAFDILETHKETSANCNQVIMLITDGMEYNETIQSIFRKYNWERGNNSRVFSFLIGEQIPESDFEQVKLMACENRGYYTQIDTVLETRENALKYIPVMSRPLVLSSYNPIVWSNVYVDIMDPSRTSNHDWDCKQREMQRVRAVEYLENYEWYPCITKNDPEQSDPEYRKFVFMTTVSMPAFERGNNTSLMGVAAIDVPLFEFERLFQNYRIGVGGYVFIIDTNGNILTHPDFRPFFQGKVLKPSYNSVDMTEIEFIDDGSDARDFSSYLLDLRMSIINSTSGSRNMAALQPYDDMRRVLHSKRKYFWKRITDEKSSPFSVIVSFPDHLSGRIQVPESEIESMMAKGSKLVEHFKNDFKLHPDWIYCRGIRKGFEDIKLGQIDPDNCEMTPEEELIFYLEKFEETGMNWKQDKLDSNETRCDRKLMQLLLHDAKATDGFPADFNKRSKEMAFIEKFHVRTSFISTHSGLLRYRIFDKKIRGDKFADSMKRSIDEVWYRRAVEFNRKAPDSFVYSVPFNAYEQNDPRILATHTIFIHDGPEKAPIAVVGFQFAHAKLERIMEIKCPRNKEELCYILDDNAYILSDPDAMFTGKFFGSVDHRIMQILVDDRVYESTNVYDYQAVCYEDRMVDYDAIMKRNSALRAMLFNPFKYLFAALLSLVSTALAVPAYMANMMYPDDQRNYDPEMDRKFYCPNIHKRSKLFMRCLGENGVWENDTSSREYMECFKKQEQEYKKCFEEHGAKYILKRHLNRSRPTKCDKFNVVYSLTKNESNFLKPYDKCSRPFVVHRIAHSNLILLVIRPVPKDCEQPHAPYKAFNDLPQTIDYFENSTFCHKLSKPQLYRHRPKSCMTHHKNEPEYNPKNADRSQCGRGNQLKATSILIVPLTLALLKIFHFK